MHLSNEGTVQKSKSRRHRRPSLSAQVMAKGILELHGKGFGFLRNPSSGLGPSPSDVYVGKRIVETWQLRDGNLVRGTAINAGRGQSPRLKELHEIEGVSPDQWRECRPFTQRTPINPHSPLKLETGPLPLTTRVVDLLVPIGKGQRGLIVAPPRSGKTILLQHIGKAIGELHPEVKLIVLLIDERPEEVTEMQRQMPGEVFASSLDCTVENHVRLSKLVLQRCKRMTEQGQNVVLLIDSLTRMSRAFNKQVGKGDRRTTTGGLDIRALDVPKQLFATARAFEEGGSLTTIATALVQTGNRMDDAIFEEFKGTGNMDLALDRQLADRRVWPAIDIAQSSTRHEELLLNSAELQATTALRRVLSSMHPVEAMQRLTEQLANHPTNDAFVQRIASQSAANT